MNDVFKVLELRDQLEKFEKQKLRIEQSEKQKN